MSFQSQVSYLPATERRTTRKLVKETPNIDRGGNVLPAATTSRAHAAHQRKAGIEAGLGMGRDPYGYSAASGSSSMAAQPSGSSHGLSATLAQAKEKRKARKKADEAATKSNFRLDEDGVAHDSEYVQFRTVEPVWSQPRKPKGSDSGSSSSSSASGGSDGTEFPASPYTYTSTHRTTVSSKYSSKMQTTASAVPPYMGGDARRSSGDYGTNLAVPRAPSPRRASADSKRPAGSSSMYSSRSTGKHLTTSSYQPPAPGFSSIRATDFSSSLRLDPVPSIHSGSAHSISDRTAKLTLTESLDTLGSGGSQGQSGYNKYAKSQSQRPPVLEGSALDAGMHGMKRSWDGFRLEMRFGANKVGKKVSRKIQNI